MSKFINFILGTKPQQSSTVPSHQITAYKKAQLERAYIKKESQIGATLFGMVPSGHNRDFFCLDEYVWIWNEQWFDADQNSMQQMQIRYEFQPRGVLKTVDGITRGYVEGKELQNLLQAIKSYHDRVAVEVYGYAPAHA